MISQAQLLQVDFVEENAAANLLPRSPLYCSHKLDWDGVTVQSHHQPAWEIPEYTPTQHMLVVHQRHHTNKSERVLDGRLRQEHLNQGDIAVIPASVAHKSLWCQDCDFTLLMLEPDHVAQIAHEVIDGDQVQIVPHFAQPDPLIYQIGLALKAELESEQPCGRLYIDSLTTALAVHLIRNYSALSLEDSVTGEGLPTYQLNRVVEYIHAHLNQEIKLLELAQVAGMSQYYFCRLFKQAVGATPHQYVLQQRVERAKHLLKQHQYLIADIAIQCGFANQSHLNRHFKRLVGVTPTNFLKQ